MPLYSPRAACIIAFDPSLQPACVIALLEVRRDHVVRDVEADRVRQRAFEPVAGLDKHLVVFHEDEQDRAVVASFLADAPGLRDALRVIGDRRSLCIVR